MKTSVAAGLLAITIAASFGTAALAKNDTISVEMKQLNGSGETGTATLTQRENGVEVTLALKNAPKGDQPTHIHAGTCGNINKAPEYPLSNTTDGTSKTFLKGLKLSDLTSSKYAINVHKSADDLGTYVACGDIAQ